MENKYELIKKALLLAEDNNPIKIVRSIMHQEFISIHGPEHHFLDGGALMVAIHNAGIDFDLNSSLDELAERAAKMPGAMCGYWGICGSVASVTAVLSIIHQVGPLSTNDYYAEDMELSSSIIKKMSEIGGPRCCKRNAFLSLSAAISFVKDKYGIHLEGENITCEFSNFNKQCIEERCPFYKKMNNKMSLEYKNLKIRFAEVSDSSILCNWWSDGKVMAHAGFPLGLKTNEKELEDRLKTNKDNKNVILIMEFDNKPIGEMSYYKNDDGTVDIGIKICEFEYQNQGIGRIALSLLIQELFNIGFDIIKVNTNMKNIRAQHVYESLGFVKTGETIDSWKNQIGELQSTVYYDLNKDSFKSFCD